MARCGVRLVPNVLLFRFCRSFGSSVRAVREICYSDKGFIFTSTPDAGKGGSGSSGSEGFVGRRRGGNAARETRSCGSYPGADRCATWRLAGSEFSLSHHGRPAENSLGDQHEGHAGQSGVEQVPIGPVRNVSLPHEGRAAQSGLQRTLSSLCSRLCRHADGLPAPSWLSSGCLSCSSTGINLPATRSCFGTGGWVRSVCRRGGPRRGASSSLCINRRSSSS